jgi:hypothetical protein
MKLKAALLWLCGLSMTAAAASQAVNDTHNRASAMTSIRVQIGEKVFTARLEDNETARAFAAMLPLKLDMRDLNDNEKVIVLSKKLPGEASNPGTIREGDLMIWSSRSLVLFYKTFSTNRERHFSPNNSDESLTLIV